MLSRLVMIREFVTRELHGIAGPECITVEPRQNPDGSGAQEDPAYSVVTLNIHGKRYGLSVKGSNLAPPLGEILLTDRQTGEIVRGAVQELVWREVAEHIRAAHRGDEKRGVAPAAPDTAPVAAVLPLAPPPDGRRPSIGMPIVYTPHPSQARGGVLEIGGLCTKVYPDGTIAATLLPYASEPYWVDRVPRRRMEQDLAVWDFVPAAEVKPEVAGERQTASNEPKRKKGEAA